MSTSAPPAFGAYVAHPTPCRPGSTLASARIARHLADRLGAILVDAEAALPPPDAPIEVLVIVNGPLAFCPWREALYGLAARARRLAWAQNDYAIALPRPVRERRPALWTTLADSVAAAPPGSAHVNWNRLGFDPAVAARPRPWPRQPGLFYWGAWRAGRAAAFARYLGPDAPYPVAVSASARALPKFRALNPGLAAFEPFKDPASIGRFGATLYAEDDASHREYHCPATRLYEALAAGLAILVDRDAAPTLARAGFDPAPWLVASAADVAARLPEARAVAAAQAEAWARDHRAELDAEVATAWNALHAA